MAKRPYRTFCITLEVSPDFIDVLTSTVIAAEDISLLTRFPRHVVKRVLEALLTRQQCCADNPLLKSLIIGAIIETEFIACDRLD